MTCCSLQPSHRYALWAYLKSFPFCCASCLSSFPALSLGCPSSHYFSFHCAAAHGCQLAAEDAAGVARLLSQLQLLWRDDDADDDDDARPHIDFSALCLFAYKYPKDMFQILVWLPSAGPACLPASGYPVLSHVRM